MSISNSNPSRRGGREGHYFAPQPGSESRPREARLKIPGRELVLLTDAGVFSAGRVDLGTQVLLEKAPPPPAAGDLLDLGCGYGPVALWLAAQAPAARVWAVDVNERAVALCRENADRNGLSNVTACAPSEVPAAVRFAAIYSNPPVRVGRDALRALLVEWLSRLLPEGAAHLVVQHHLGSDSLLRWLVAQGWDARRLASKKSYRVLEVRAKPSWRRPA